MQFGSVLLIVLGAAALGQSLTIIPCNETANNLTWLTLADDPMAVMPDDDTVVDCSAYAHILTPAQMRLCELQDKNYLPCMALGIKRAIQWCQKVYKDSLWNCTTWVGDYVLGKLVHNYATRERAVVVAMVSAGITMDIAACCREEKLKDCPCKKPDWPRREEVDEYGERTVIYPDCGDNVETAKSRTWEIIGVSEDEISVQDRIDHHNAALGTQMGMKTVEVCRCHGITGSCNVKTCKYKTVEYEEVANAMPAKYDSASVVICNETVKNLESDGPGDDPTSEDLVYCCDSPYLCERNEMLGIPGTSGRECNPTDRTAPNYCGSLCCGRGYYSVTTRKPIEECTFVYCCRFDCTVVGYEEETKHYCK